MSVSQSTTAALTRMRCNTLAHGTGPKMHRGTFSGNNFM